MKPDKLKGRWENGQWGFWFIHDFKGEYPPIEDLLEFAALGFPYVIEESVLQISPRPAKVEEIVFIRYGVGYEYPPSASILYQNNLIPISDFIAKRRSQNETR